MTHLEKLPTQHHTFSRRFFVIHIITIVFLQQQFQTSLLSVFSRANENLHNTTPIFLVKIMTGKDNCFSRKGITGIWLAILNGSNTSSQLQPVFSKKGIWKTPSIIHPYHLGVPAIIVETLQKGIGPPTAE
jgi:hypothetical protein